MDSSHGIPSDLNPEKDFCPPPQVKLKTPSPAKRPKSSPNNLSFQETSPSPRARRKSLRRSVGKKHRRTLPPIYNKATALSDAISLSIPEGERLVELLHACFQYSVCKLENSLSHVEGFNAKSFSANVSSVRAKIARFTERLSLDGKIQRCIEGSSSSTNNQDEEELQTKIKDGISVLTGECRQWEELLEEYKKKADDESRQLEENGEISCLSESYSHLQAPQETVLQSKPDYKGILDQQGAVLDSMDIALDGLQESVQFIESFASDSASHLHQLSTQLKSKSFKPMEDSPVRVFLNVFKK